MQAYTYLLVNFMSVIVCFIFSFHKRIQFNKHFAAFFKACALAAIPFVAWDIWFTKTGVWSFNSSYTLGLKIAGLPIEEWLFFVCIPFSCVFTFFWLDKFFNLSRANKYTGYIVWITLIVCIIVAVFFNHHIYTFVTAVFTAITVFYLHYIVKVHWIGEASLVFFILMPAFFLVNGVLTGTGLASAIVNYNSKQILNIRMGTIPVEDTVYGYSQFLLTIYFFKIFQKTNSNEK